MTTPTTTSESSLPLSVQPAINLSEILHWMPVVWLMEPPTLQGIIPCEECALWNRHTFLFLLLLSESDLFRFRKPEGWKQSTHVKHFTWLSCIIKIEAVEGDPRIPCITSTFDFISHHSITITSIYSMYREYGLQFHIDSIVASNYMQRRI